MLQVILLRQQRSDREAHALRDAGLNCSDTSEQVTPIKISTASPICIDIVDSDDDEQAVKGKLKSMSMYHQ